jgi:ABC-2 type transport system ATP-binding protein
LTEPALNILLYPHKAPLLVVENTDLAVEVKNLVKVYDGTVRALDGVDLSVEPGKVFALLGPNGAGKTTLMRILTTQLKPTSGEAYVFGLDVVRRDSEIRKIVGYIPQEMSVWTDVTGFDNLLIYAKIYRVPSNERSKIIWEILGIMGLDHVAKNTVKTYSGGMIRRLEIACTLLIRPKVLFLDEPTIGLDPSARRAVWEELASFKKEYGSTMFFNTHYMDEADLYSDEIAIINSGKIVKLGTAEELKRSIGGEVILLSIADDHSGHIGEDVLNKIKESNLVSDVIVDNSEIRVIVKDAETSLPNVIEILRSENIAMKKISMTKPTLDDVFLKYAGIKLETGGGISEVRQVRRMIRR